MEIDPCEMLHPGVMISDLARGDVTMQYRTEFHNLERAAMMNISYRMQQFRLLGSKPFYVKVYHGGGI
jgi:hypothetical protein